MKAKHIIWTYTKILIVIAMIVAIVWGAIEYLQKEYKEENFETIKTNMLLIQAKIQVVAEKKAMKEKGADYIGKPIIEMAEDEKVKELIKKDIIDPNAKKSEYYILTNEDLVQLELQNIQLEDAYYVVDYKTDEVIYTEGITDLQGNVVYKLSEIKE